MTAEQLALDAPAASNDDHQPRERSVRCSRCLRRTTWNVDAICDGCRYVTVERQGRWLVLAPSGELVAIFHLRDVAERRAAFLNNPKHAKAGKR